MLKGVHINRQCGIGVGRFSLAGERLRVGYAVGQWLVYATGGYAWSQARLGETPGLLADEDRVLRTHTGWAAGTGVEVAIAAD